MTLAAIVLLLGLSVAGGRLALRLRCRSRELLRLSESPEIEICGGIFATRAIEHQVCAAMAATLSCVALVAALVVAALHWL